MRRLLNKLKGDSNNKTIAKNIIGAFLVKGASLVISLFTIPSYLRFFKDNNSLGVWFTIISVLNWILIFDFGLGNGLRNILPNCLANDDKDLTKRYISSTYAGTIFLSSVLLIIGSILILIVDWNSFLKISSDIVSTNALKCSIFIVFLGIIVQIVLKTINSILYALQKSAVVNFLSMISAIIILLLVNIIPSTDTERNLLHMSLSNAIASNIPLLIATIYVFSHDLKNYLPNTRLVSVKCMKEVLNIGVTILWLMIIAMVITNTNEILIARLTSSEDVVDFQIYFKVFNTVSTVFALSLAPIWSAVTKASVEKNYKWIKKLYTVLLLLFSFVLVAEFAIIPIFQFIIDIWLGNNYMVVDYRIEIVMAIFCSLTFLHNVNTSVGNGMSFFDVQKIWMTFAAIVDIPLAILFVNITGSWIGVVLANIFAILPFEIIEIFAFYRMINRKQLDGLIQDSHQ